MIRVPLLRASAGYGGQIDRPDRLPAGGLDVAARVRSVRWRLVMVVALLLAVLVAVFSLALREPRLASRAADRGVARSMGLSSLPLTAQGVVSGALGANGYAYRVDASNDGFQALNPAQHLRARYESSGVTIDSGKARLGLSLRAVGYGAALTALGRVAPRARANRVVFARRGLSEWYANGPLGLEQGFTLTRAPVGDAREPLTLSLALSGSVRASVEAGGRGLTLTATGSSALRYDNLLATDARGRALHAWISLRGGQVLLHVDTRDARYPLNIDPLIQQAKLTDKEYGRNGGSATAWHFLLMATLR